ncbi:helix-turn-helix transcriptional regulator [Embleya scabrispora]|uniref:helix-turn-helix transcriptional regulator n=1 Tax=Embleya scabrispora TaxID=159449 RepID=UPI00035C225B|nr:YafY family protein [Embleya scabrispora]MYS80959.1 WYL domain-containing protein [Streptomyces sp. SID5474]
MRASRLVSILLLLQTRGRVTAREIAETLEVSVRTIYRDMESLSAAGVPLYADPGHRGGYELLDGFRTRLTGLTTGEAESLFLTGLPTAAADLGLGSAVTAAHLKLMAALPPELRDRAGRIAECFHLDAPSWYGAEDHTPHLAEAADAVWNRRRLRIRYLRWAEPHENTRVVAPYGVVLKAGAWYLVAGHVEAYGQGRVEAEAAARGGTGARIRTYRVSRILDLDALAETFERPAGFALAGYWEEYLDRFDRRRHRASATVRMSPIAMKRLTDVLEPVVVRAAHTSATRPDADGWVEVVLPIESVDSAITTLLPFGGEAEVLGPPELRAGMRASATALARVYGGRDAEADGDRW